MNEIITFLSENWYVIVVVLILLFGIYYTITNKEKVKEWLKWAVTTVEKELGTKTGQLKLRKVYDMFIQNLSLLQTRKLCSLADF